MEQSTKMLGGVGYVIMIVLALFGSLLGPVAFLSIVGAICVLVAFIRAGKELNKPAIKSAIITAVVLYIIAGVIMMFTVGASIAAVLTAANSGAGAQSALAAVGGSALIGFLIFWVLSIVSTWFWYKASKSLTEATGQNLFKLGGLLMFIGAICLILFGLGGILLLIGQILQCIGFFVVPERSSVPASTGA